ncbi:MAG: N-6 DNA methylase [Prochlorotrichaceae cyanobacterium]
MAVTVEQLKAVMTGSAEQRVTALQVLLGYPLQQKDPGRSEFWYLRPGVDESEAEDTRPIAVRFLSLLNQADDAEIKRSLTEEDPSPIQRHYLNRTGVDQPALYILLPEAPRTGRIAFVLPGETQQLRQRNIQTWEWQATELLNRFRRISNAELPIAAKALLSIPLVERVFYEPAKTAEQLAKALAIVARQMERAIPEAHEKESNQGYLHNLLLSFQRELIPNLKLSSENEKDYSFSDIYAQTIAYGLFTARVFSYAQDQKEEGKQTDFNRENAWALLPETNPFLRQLFHDVSDRNPAELGETLTDAIAEIFGILRAAEMKTILDDFRAKMNREDIVIRFYEDFLAAYKPQMRERRGVYYTPEPVVSYMVRSVDVLLKEKFNKPLGLADPEVMILDPACGTGTFLLWIFQLIHQRFKENPEALTDGLADQSWSGYVKERLLPRIFGFELLMAPYAIAHLKLGLFLEETGYSFDGGKRLGVYLTNTLDQALQKSELLFKEFIAEESDQAAAIKRDKPIMLVMGNPPYSVNSANKSKWIETLVRDTYYPKDEMKEQNPKMLLDDYVKFIRFGQWRIDKTQQGILGFITNHGYLDNPTFRAMRRSLEKSFNQMYVMDLHGNTKKKEVSPDGSKDENVFDIQQGVSVCFLLKNQMIS